jgi:L,D-peptidoglycan transpeptidase YkuD (ErfK/YbiS/YcfS/YnhG family)/plasmid stability protein
MGCSAPKIPPEVRLAEEQALSLRSAGAAIYAPREYGVYSEVLTRGKQDLAREESKLRWFRDYRSVEAEFRNIIQQGGKTLEKIREEKELEADRIEGLLTSYQRKIATLRELTLKISGGERAREDLMKAEVILSEAGFLNGRGEYASAAKKMDSLSARIRAAEDFLLPIFGRYSDRRQIFKWRRWAKETIAESREKGTMVFIVNKSDRTLTVYGNGKPVRVYHVGLGSNGAMDKRHAGDNATPEGRYRVIGKVPGSRYYRALLLNYPNTEDRKQFIQAKEKGLIPQKAGIGGLIEIHGGGAGGLTNGCISLENFAMRELFGIASVGTPVTIVGALQYENRISSTLKGL